MQLDESNRADHRHLAPEDPCFYFGEFFARSEVVFSATQRLIADYQCLPSMAAADPERRAHKERALTTIADGLSAAIGRAGAEAYTWVPVPPPFAIDHPEYDDRLSRALRAAFAGFDGDVRPVLAYAGEGEVEHRSRARTGPDALYRRLWVDVAAARARPLRAGLVLFDDVLCTGAHFSAAARRLRELRPDPLPIVGVFLARRILGDPSEDQ
jgi:hypothetical protein